MIFANIRNLIFVDHSSVRIYEHSFHFPQLLHHLKFHFIYFFRYFGSHLNVNLFNLIFHVELLFFHLICCFLIRILNLIRIIFIFERLGLIFWYLSHSFVGHLDFINYPPCFCVLGHIPSFIIFSREYARLS